MASWPWAIQMVETAKNKREACQMLRGWAVQDGYLGERLLPPSPSKPGWRIQGFMRNEPEAKEGVLPKGMRRVIMPPSIFRVMSRVRRPHAAIGVRTLPWRSRDREKEAQRERRGKSRSTAPVAHAVRSM